MIAPKADELRFELKAVLSTTHAEEFDAAIWVREDRFIRSYPGRQVSSVYFDTLDLRCARANVDGISARRKLRFRWYGQTTGCERGQLELKCKQQGLGWKRTWPINHSFSFLDITWAEFTQTLSRLGDQTARHLLNELPQPVSVITYHREYYESRDRAVRITVDTEIRSYDQILRLRPSLTDAEIQREEVVIEVKGLSSNHERIRKAVESLPIGIAKNSKYTRGISAAIH